MKNYRFLVPIVLVLLLLVSLYSLYSGKAADQEVYENYLNTARDYREMEIYVDAEYNYQLALEERPSLELYLELGSLYDEFGMTYQMNKMVRNLLKEFPDEVAAYEFAVDMYLQKNDYAECFYLADTARNRGLSSEKLDTIIDAIEYQFYFGPEYDEVGVFGGGMSPVQVGDRWGYITTYGDQTVEASFVTVGPFSYDEIAPVVDADGNAYFIDMEGYKKKVVLNVENIKQLGMSESGIFSLYNGKTWGFYNIHGEMLFGEYEEVSNIGNGTAAVMNGGKWQIVDKTGKDMTGKTYAAVQQDEKGIIYRNDRCFVSDGNGWQMIDINGNVYSKQTYEDARVFNDATYAAVKVGGKWGFVDMNGNMVIEPQYDDARSFSNELAAVKVGDRWGFIDLEGTMVIEPNFLDSKDLSYSGTVFVQTGKEWELLVLYKYNH